MQYSVLLLCALCTMVAAADKLPSLQCDLAKTTVSGISAGGYMAVQYHVAHSSSVLGAGVQAGGPFMCSEGNMMTALMACMTTPDSINMDDVYATTDGWSGDLIDNTSNLKGQKVWLFSGRSDTVVFQGVMEKLNDFYQHYGADTTTVFDVSAQHAWITDFYGSSCSTLGSPYINNCDLDSAGTLLQLILGKLNNRTTMVEENLVEFDQEEFGSGDAGLDSMGYAYIPKACRDGSIQCLPHVCFHGCTQQAGNGGVGTKFVTNSGLNQWAEANNMVVLYPQVVTSMMSNPKACFDWWGYTNSDFANKNGPQMRVVEAMLNRIGGKA